MVYILRDPNNQFKNVTDEQFNYLIGLIPRFVDPDLPYDKLIDHAILEYGFGGPEMTGHSIDENLVMSYPGDPDLHPVAVIKTVDAQVIIYQYGIVTFLSLDGEKEITYRMD